MTSRRAFLTATAALGLAAGAPAGAAELGDRGPGAPVRPQRPGPQLRALLRQVDERRIEATVRRLAAFGTRHTLSAQDDPGRGIGAARAWLLGQFQQVAGASGGRLTVELQSYVQPPADRIPVPTTITNVVATLHGSTDPGRVYVVSGHYDSRRTDVMDFTGDAPGAAELVEELTDRGAEVSVVACDVADRAQLAAVLAEMPESDPLRGVVHAAGVAQDGADVVALTLDEVEGVLRSKVEGARHLDELVGDRPLDFFVLYSSVSGMLGSGKLSAYAAANAYLNALAEDRERRGLPGVSIGWGVWGEAGMALQGDMLEHMQRHGLVPLVPEEAMVAFGRALSVRGSLLAADFDWNRFAQTFTLPRESALLSELPEVRQALSAGDTERDAVVAEATLHEELAGLAPAERRDALLELVRTVAAELLGYGEPGDIEPSQAFREMGVDSLAAVEVRNVLGERTGLRLPSTLVFDHPTSQAVAAHLHRELFGDEDDVPASAEEARVRKFLASVSFDQLRSLGLMELLSEAADRADEPEAPDEDGDVGDMDADDLVRFVLGGDQD
ncbi:SDR family oxidoreductase [Amycolatopsis solani]|uniref:SDR family oxidoreductase n=1 Tax=Amycolatopsis solani TaxID=3028615 RepID=UPI0025B23419|nr:SDR family oxidoreductase [Amycolatopsis sp. MEP2-6]